MNGLERLNSCRMSSQYSHTQIPDSPLNGEEKQLGFGGRTVKTLKLHPSIGLALVVVVLLQVKTQLPSFHIFSLLRLKKRSESITN